jgi:hypothetical protein
VADSPAFTKSAQKPNGQTSPTFRGSPALLVIQVNRSKITMREARMVSTKLLVNQWRSEPSSHSPLGHELAFTKSADEPGNVGEVWNGIKLGSNTPPINKLRASHGDGLALNRIGSALNGAG